MYISKSTRVVNTTMEYVTGDPGDTTITVIGPKTPNTLNLEELRAVAYEMLRVVDDIEDSND